MQGLLHSRRLLTVAFQLVLAKQAFWPVSRLQRHRLHILLRVWDEQMQR